LTLVRLLAREQVLVLVALVLLLLVLLAMD